MSSCQRESLFVGEYYTMPNVRTSQTTKRMQSAGPIGFKPYRLKKTEEYMNEGMLEHFRNILLLWKQQLMEEVDGTIHTMQDTTALPPDPLDRASQEEEFRIELRTRDRERQLSRKIEEALNNIDEGNYGYCKDCDAEIGIRRLEARPTATQCIDCKTFQEIREKQTGG